MTMEEVDMGTGDALRHTIKQEGRDLGGQLRRAAADRGHGNVASRHNVVVAGSVGGDGESHAASSSQRVRIRQDGDEQVEEVVTLRENASS